MRTGTEQFNITEWEPVRDSDCSFVTNRRPTYGTSVKTLSDFTPSQGEETAMTELQLRGYNYRSKTDNQGTEPRQCVFKCTRLS